MEGKEVLVYIDGGSELLLVDEDWLRTCYPDVFQTRTKGERWEVSGIGDEALVATHQVWIELSHTYKRKNRRITKTLRHEALIVPKLGEPILAGRLWQDKAQITISRHTDPDKRKIRSDYFGCEQQPKTAEEYEAWSRAESEEGVKELVRSTTAYRTTFSHQPKDTLDGENIKNVDALFFKDSSPAGRR
jgi:hypothetical protein